MKKIILILFLGFFLTDLEAKMIVLSNQYIKISVDDTTSRFYLESLKGNPDNPSDDNQMLLKKNNPPSSLITVLINNENFIYGSEQGNYDSRPVLKGNKIVGTWKIRGLSIRQSFQIVKGPSTGLPDSMVINYKIKNESGNKVKYGTRILLDTYLGDHDGSAYRIPGVGNVSTETQFYRNNIPDYWYCFDSYDKPKVKTQGTLLGKGITRPDKIIFANWDRLYDNLWDFVVDGSKKFNRKGTDFYDGAVALYYEPLELKPKETFYTSAMYGIYGESFFSAKDLKLSLNVPAEPDALPIAVSAELKNKSKLELDTLSLNLSIPKAFHFVDGETNEMDFVKVGTNQIRQVLWHLTTKEHTGVYKVKVNVKAKVKENQQAFDAYKSFELKIPNPQGKVDTNSTEVVQLEKELTKTNTTQTNTPLVKVAKEKKTVETVTPVVVTNTMTNVVTVSKKETPESPKIRRLKKQIHDLDALIQEVDQKYQVLMGVYRNTYQTNLNLTSMEFEIQHYENLLKDLKNMDKMQKSENP